MNGLQIPIFEKGNIVTADMLDAVKELAWDYQKTGFIGFGNGILCGCEITTSESAITIGRGIVVFNEILYYITEPVSVRYQASNEWMIVQIVIENKFFYRNVEEQKLEVIVSGECDKRKDGIEVCRFRLQRGAFLRTVYRDFRDIETEYDTINVIDAKWSAYGGSTVTEKILRLFADEITKKNTQDVTDFVFCQQIYQCNGRSLSRKAVVSYINRRLQMNKEDYSNREIYQRLNEILRMQSGRDVRIQERPRRMGPIIVD